MNKFPLRFTLHISRAMATIWQTENFNRGIHTKPARIEGGELYAADIENLQVDGDGFLRLRSNFRSIGPDGADITGIAASETHLFILRSDGKLYLRDIPAHGTETDLGTEVEIPGVGPYLQGRISIINQFNDYVMLTSEGVDQGLWIDLRPSTPLQAHRLGISLPPVESFSIAQNVHSGNRDRVANSYVAGIVFYRLTYTRQFEAGVAEVPPTDPFNGMESDGSVPQHHEVWRLAANPGFQDRSTDPFLSLTLAQWMHSSDPQVTGINVYRTRVFEGQEYNDLMQKVEAGDADFGTLEFRKIFYLPRTDTGLLIDGFTEHRRTEAASEDTVEYAWEDQALYQDSPRMPSSVQSFTYHAGRIFAPVGNRLIYSDYDGTLSKFWSFPKSNEIRRTRPGRVDFCASHREVLLFGGHDGLYRLTGADPFDFDSDEISGIGPLDSYSWGTLKNSIGFVGSRGLYLTDAAGVQSLSDQALNGFFDGREVQHGTVLFFEDDTILFFAELQAVADRSDSQWRNQSREVSRNFFLFSDQHWVRWSGETVGQFVSVAGQHYVAGRDNLKAIEWRERDNTDANLPWAWESNLIHAQELGAGNITKRFIELLVSAAEGARITLRTWVDTQPRATERTFKTRDDLYFQRIPIERIGKRLRFRLEGKGPVTLRGLQIEGEV